MRTSSISFTSSCKVTPRLSFSYLEILRVYPKFLHGQNNLLYPLCPSIPLTQPFLPQGQVFIALFDFSDSGLLPALPCPLKPDIPFCLLGFSDFWSLGLSLTHGHLTLGILPSVTEVFWLGLGSLALPCSQGTNILPIRFLGFLLSENRLDL